MVLVSMKKYRLIFNNYDTNKQEIISLIGKNENEENVEICFIDLLTTKFDDENSLIQYLKNKSIISSSNGYLGIYKPNGKKISERIIYDNYNFKLFSKEICEKRKYGINSTKISETYEQKKLRFEIIDFFKKDNKALEVLQATFYVNPKFPKLLKDYLILSVPTGWKDFSTTSKIDELKKAVYSNLLSYELLRNIYFWINDYEISIQKRKFQGYNSESKIKNPYEIYEKKNNL